MVRRRVVFSTPSSSVGGARRDPGRRSRARASPGASSRESVSAGDWSPGPPRSRYSRSRPSSPSSGSHGDGESGPSGDESACAELAAERAAVRNLLHPWVALVRRQMQALQAEDLAVVAADSSPCDRRAPPLSLDATSLAVQLVSGLAPVLALVVVVALSLVGALLGALAAPWRPAPPPPPSAFEQSCLGRALASLLPSWSAWDDSPLVRPF